MKTLYTPYPPSSILNRQFVYVPTVEDSREKFRERMDDRRRRADRARRDRELREAEEREHDE